MADTKLSALAELAATPAVDDEVYIRDVSEAAAAESKRITVANLMDAVAKELWAQPIQGTEIFTQSKWTGYRLDAAGEYVHVFFKVPHDFHSITTAAFVFRPFETATEQYDLYSEYGALGAAQDQHNESSLNVQTAVTDGVIAHFDVSGVLTALAADDYVGIRISWDSGNGICMGLVFRYI